MLANIDPLKLLDDLVEEHLGSIFARSRTTTIDKVVLALLGQAMDLFEGGGQELVEALLRLCAGRTVKKHTRPQIDSDAQGELFGYGPLLEQLVYHGDGSFGPMRFATWKVLERRRARQIKNIARAKSVFDIEEEMRERVRPLMEGDEDMTLEMALQKLQRT